MPELLRFRGLERAEILGRSVPVATSFPSRLVGLALLSSERAGEGLLIPDCRSVHTFGMRFALDLLFLDQEWRVVDLRRSVPPGRLARCALAAAVLELPCPRSASRSRPRPLMATAARPPRGAGSGARFQAIDAGIH